MNPQLRVKATVFVLVNDDGAASLIEFNKVGKIDGIWQAPNIPNTLGEPVLYSGSTTGPGYNEKASPFQVTWSVCPQVMKVSIGSVAERLKGNKFEEDHAHGVRNLVTNPDLLSQISK